MHERNDEMLRRAARGRESLENPYREIGLERFLGEFGAACGRYSVCFEGRYGPRATIRHPDPFFRALEEAWNEHPDFTERDVHARFGRLTAAEVAGGFSFKERVSLIASFLTVAASALEVLATGQTSEVASLEEHARQLQLHPTLTTTEEAL